MNEEQEVAVQRKCRYYLEFLRLEPAKENEVFARRACSEGMSN